MKIDFVVTWLDPSDKEWQASYRKYCHLSRYKLISDQSTERFRDWGFFKYWFRAIDRYAPWVNKIHVITCGHVPEWLDINHEKINFVKHADYIEGEYLPTFNSRVIELSLVNLECLSETFVLFNDDFFANTDLLENDFFSSDGLPCDFFINNAESGGGLSPVIMNNLELINDTFDKRDFSISSFFNVKYNSHNLKNLLLLPWPNFTGFYESHLPQPYLKSNCERAYSVFKKDIERTLQSRFRLKSDVNHYLYRYFQLCDEKFYPSRPNALGRYYSAEDSNIAKIISSIEKSNEKIIAINDNNNISDFEWTKRTIVTAFENKFPFKSSFEV